MNFGTEPHKLHRTESPATSIGAAYEVDTTEMERLVYETILKAGAVGMISDDVRWNLPGYSYSSVTARYSALIEKGLIERTGEKRKGKSGRGQSVMMAVKQDHKPVQYNEV